VLSPPPEYWIQAALTVCDAIRRDTQRPDPGRSCDHGISLPVDKKASPLFAGRILRGQNMAR